MITFAEPQWLWALAVLPLLIFLFFRNEGQRRAVLQRLVAERLLDRLAGSVSVSKRRVRFFLLLLGLAGVILSLAQPQYGHTYQQVQRKGRDIIIAIDTSRSMLANDLPPSRLLRAKLAAQDLIALLPGDRIGLVAFAGGAFLQAPLTIDHGSVLNALTELDTEIIPRGGTNIAGAIHAAVDAFGEGETEHRALVLFTDGEELDADGVKVAEKQEGAIRIFTVGLGSPEGALIPTQPDGGGANFVRDRAGNFVKSRLDEERLRAIAEATGGFYVHMQNGRPEMQHIARDGLARMTEQEIDARLSRQPIARYQWPLSAGLVLLAASWLMSERRRAPARAAAAALAAALLVPCASEARNSGVEAYRQENYQGAQEEFARQLRMQPDSAALHFNYGSAAYKAGELDKALESFSKAVTSSDPRLRARAQYNLGNTLFQRGAGHKDKAPKLQEWKNALQHYDEVLRVDPKDEDAEYNRNLVQHLIDELQKEPPPSEDQKKQDQQKQDKEKKDKNKDQQKQDSDKEKQDQQQQGGNSDEEQKQDGQSDNQEKQDGKKDEGDPSGKGDQEEEEKSSGDSDKSDEEEDGKPDSEGADEPMPEQEGENESPEGGDKPDGELESKGPAPGEDKEEQEGDREAEEAAAAAAGQMTPQQAENLLESLRGEDRKVQLLKDGEPKQRRVLRDW